jgi:hypothetical protein
VVGSVANIEMTFLQQLMVGFRLSEESGLWRWCRFNASVSNREGKQWDKALSKDEVDAINSSWLHRKEV